MVNVFEKLLKENEEQIIIYTNELKELGFTDSDIQDCRDIYNLKYELMYEESNKGICEDYEISYNNGYERGLYKGAKMQLQSLIDKLIEDKVGKVIFYKNIDLYVVSTVRKLYIAEAVKREIILDAEEYDENIAVIGEKKYNDYTEKYYIVARKNKYYADYEYFKIDSDRLQQDYKPTESELELLK